ncbi:ATP-binding protein [Thermosulfuriphilus sp.]
MGYKGRIFFETRFQKVDRHYCREHGNAREGRFAVIRIKDQGKGIRPQDLSRIFDPYFSRNKGKDRGLGLAITYSLVRKRGGWIDVQSLWGKGSTFEIFLPLVHKENIKA